MEQTETIKIRKETLKKLALYQLQRELKNRSEAIEDALQKAIQLEQLK